METKNNKHIQNNIYLIGFMGAGKSQTAQELAEQLSMEVVEMDEMIVQAEGKTIKEIFAENGEAYFRDTETALLEKIGKMQGAVVSCGGGVPLKTENVKIMRNAGKTVFLTASPEVISERIGSSTDRPLLQKDKIKELMDKRQSSYESAADIVVNTDNKATAQICNEIIDKLGMERR